MIAHEERGTTLALSHTTNQRRSQKLKLVLIGAAGAGLLSGCGCDPSFDRVSRDVYETREACEADFSKANCEFRDGFESPIKGEAVIVGPTYPSPDAAKLGYVKTPRVGSRAVAVIVDDVRRGGFGFSAACRQSNSYSG